MSDKKEIVFGTCGIVLIIEVGGERKRKATSAKRTVSKRKITVEVAEWV